MQAQPLGWEDPLEEGMATHSSILSWRIPWTEEPGGLQFMGSQRTGHSWASEYTITYCNTEQEEGDTFTNVIKALSVTD